MHPSNDELITYPLELNKTDNFSKISTKISFFVESFTLLSAAVEVIVVCLNISKGNLEFVV